jgi:hypothetical protein
LEFLDLEANKAYGQRKPLLLLSNTRSFHAGFEKAADIHLCNFSTFLGKGPQKVLQLISVN